MKLNIVLNPSRKFKNIDRIPESRAAQVQRYVRAMKPVEPRSIRVRPMEPRKRD